MQTSLPRLRGLAVSAQGFRRLALANALMLLVVVATGATVRLTSSGLGCRHWPGCQAGDPFPEKGYHSFVEFGNRIVAATVIAVTLVTWLASRLTPTLPRRVRWLALAAFLGTFAQAPLGALTVHYHLNPWLVLSHFLLSLVVLTLGVLIVLDAWEVSGELLPRGLRLLGLVLALAAAVLVVTGTLSTAAGPHPGSFPVRRIGSFQPAVWLHVRATAAFGIVFATLLLWLARRHSPRLRFGLAVLAVLALQMLVGEIQYRTKLPWWLVLCHVTLAATLWGATAAFVASLWRPSRMR